jgi:hypothetical protein
MSLTPILAHGLPSPPGVPVPGYLFAWAASIVLIASFVALGAMWREPRLEGAPARRVVRMPLWVEPACGLLGIAVFVLLVYAGFQGSPVPGRNLAPTFVYVVFWVGLVPITVLFGDVFSLFNPWRAVARAVGRMTHRLSPEWVAPTLRYPERLGYWPAVIGLAAYAWLELVDPGRSAPDTVAEAALVYAGLQLVGMALFGVESWERRGDAFAVYFALFARLSPVQLRGRDVYVGRALAASTRLDVGAGLVALLCVMIGTTSFDGLSSTVQWSSLAPDLQRAFTGIGLSAERALELAFTFGLAGMILLVGGFYRMGVAGMRSVDRSFSREELAGRFIHTLIPIAAAYVLAHYFTFLVFQGQAMDALVSDPLGRGSDLFGTAHVAIDYSLISKAAVWYFQVGALVCGHVGGLVLAHDRALAVYSGGRRATRSQYWMLTVMVGFTSLGLFLLASIKR